LFPFFKEERCWFVVKIKDELHVMKMIFQYELIRKKDKTGYRITLAEIKSWNTKKGEK